MNIELIELSGHLTLIELIELSGNKLIELYYIKYNMKSNQRQRINNDADEYAKKLASARHWLSQKDHDKSTKDGENLGLKCSKDSYPPFDDVTDKW